MKVLVTLLAAVACQAAPQLPYSVVQTAPIVAHGQSLSPAVMKIDKPGIRFGIPQPVVYSPAPAPVPVPVAPAVTTYGSSIAVQAAAPAALIPSAPVVAQAVYAAPAAAPAVPIPPAPVVAQTVYAVPPEPLQAPVPPMPSLGTPFVGGQFHAQDEAGQYSFGHWGGPNTRVETRDNLGRTAGSFAYIDPVGEVQVRKYAAAPATGFKVAASDLP